MPIVSTCCLNLLSQPVASTCCLNLSGPPTGPGHGPDSARPGPVFGRQADDPTRPDLTGLAVRPGPTRPVITGQAARPGPTRPVITGQAPRPGPTRPDLTGQAARPGPARPDLTGQAARPGPARPDFSPFFSLLLNSRTRFLLGLLSLFAASLSSLCLDITVFLRYHGTSCP
jgi:hypothetical protein